MLWQVLRRVTQSDNAYQHPWAPGDLIIWDQRRTLHCRVPYDAEQNDRLMYRMDFERDPQTQNRRVSEGSSNTSLSVEQRASAPAQAKL